MSKQEYQGYLNTKNKILKQILDIYEFKLDYEKDDLIMIYYDLKPKTLKYLVYYYNNLLKKL